MWWLNLSKPPDITFVSESKRTSNKLKWFIESFVYIIPYVNKKVGLVCCKSR